MEDSKCSLGFVCAESFGTIRLLPGSCFPWLFFVLFFPDLYLEGVGEKWAFSIKSPVACILAPSLSGDWGVGFGGQGGNYPLYILAEIYWTFFNLHKALDYLPVTPLQILDLPTALCQEAELQARAKSNSGGDKIRTLARHAFWQPTSKPRV
jgi:hypothetical protein